MSIKTMTPILAAATLVATPLLAVEVDPAIDTDADGLPDEWEMQFGLQLGSRDGADDPDMDDLRSLCSQSYQWVVAAPANR